jgi:NTP pyrophosphatase (non-canonical NTP hydrolase)
MKHKELYKKLIDLNGFEDQLGYFYEEIGELLQAINKYKRANGRITKFDIFSEIVDVQITLDILKIGYGMTYTDFINLDYIKIEKLRKYVNNVSDKE